MLRSSSFAGQELPAGFLSRAPALRKITITETNLHTLPEHFLAVSIDLQSVDLSHNELRSIEQFPVDALRTMVLAANHLTSFNLDLRSASHLRMLDLSVNNLGRVPPYLPKHAFELNLEDNPIPGAKEDVRAQVGSAITLQFKTDAQELAERVLFATITTPEQSLDDLIEQEKVVRDVLRQLKNMTVNHMGPVKIHKIRFGKTGDTLLHLAIKYDKPYLFGAFLELVPPEIENFAGVSALTLALTNPLSEVAARIKLNLLETKREPLTSAEVKRVQELRAQIKQFIDARKQRLLKRRKKQEATYRPRAATV